MNSSYWIWELLHIDCFSKCQISLSDKSLSILLLHFICALSWLKNHFGSTSFSTSIMAWFVGVDPALLTINTTAFSDGSPVWMLHRSYYSERKTSAALVHNVLLLCWPLCYLEVTPLAVMHIHQQSSICFYFFFITPGTELFLFYSNMLYRNENGLFAPKKKRCVFCINHIYKFMIKHIILTYK